MALPRWPADMKAVLTCHMQQVHIASKMPPLFTSGQTVQDAIVHATPFLQRQFPSVDERAKTDCAITFILDLFEQCCVCSFLTPKERRHVLLTSQRAGKKLAPVKTAPLAKKRRTDEAVPKQHYSNMLSAEYLVRFLASLPLILDHFQRMAENTAGFAAETLWSRVQCLLEALASFKYFAMEQYLPIV